MPSKLRMVAVRLTPEEEATFAKAKPETTSLATFVKRLALTALGDQTVHETHAGSVARGTKAKARSISVPSPPQRPSKSRLCKTHGAVIDPVRGRCARHDCKG